MDCVDEKLSTLENARTLPGVASPLVPTSHHIHAIGGIYVAAFLSQVQILVTKRNIYRENITRRYFVYGIIYLVKSLEM